MKHQGAQVALTIAPPDEDAGGTQYVCTIGLYRDGDFIIKTTPYHTANGATLAGVKLAINMGMVICKVDIQRCTHGN